MAIHSIPQITVNGNTTLFGGYIYSARLSIAYENPSELRLSLISEDGKYQLNPNTVLSNTFCQPYQINLGPQVKFNGYLVDLSSRISPAGNTLELTFFDTSRILDIYQIGLYKRHGLESKNQLIIVGTELNPCVADPYGNPAPIFYDPCHPCVNSLEKQAQRNYIDCVEKAKYEILDVVYNFTDLILKLKSKGFILVNAVDPNSKYTAQHTGTLREVLTSWCQDFGWFFYWDNGRIVFRDLRNTIDVTANIENFCPNVLEYQTSYSMANSVKTATITNFSRAGDPAKLYECQEAKYIKCASLVQNSSYSMPLTVTPKIDQTAAGLAYFSRDLRDIYYFYVKHQLYSVSNFTAGKKLPELGLTLRSKAIKLGNLNQRNITIHDATSPSEIPKDSGSINPFKSGNLSTKQSANVSSILDNEDYYNCVQLFDFETQWKIVTNPENYFFFLAEENLELAEKYYQEEREFASFLNKYAVYVPDPNDPFFEDYDFTLDKLCGGKQFVNTGTVSYTCTPSNVQFINTSSVQQTQIGQLPFANFLSVIRDANSGSTAPGSPIPFKLIIAERGQNPFVPNGSTQTDTGYNAIQDYQALENIKKFNLYAAQNKNNFDGEFIGRLIGNADITNSNLADMKLFLASSVANTAFNLTKINSYNNAADFGSQYDGKPLNKEQNSNLQEGEIVYQYPELQCSLLGNHSFGGSTTLHANKIIFKTPVGSFEYIEPTDALFGVVIEKTKQKRRIIEKLETFNTTNLNSDTCNYSRLLVNARNISDDRLSILTKKNDVCQFDSDQIESIHQQFSNNLTVNYTRPTVSKTFRIAGIELNGYTPTIDNGLISVEIGLDSDNGVYSTYEFGTRLMKLPNEMAFNFSKGLDMKLRHGGFTSQSNYPLIGQPNV